MAEERALKLTRLPTEEESVDYVNGFALSLVAEEATNMTDKVFVHRRRPIQPSSQYVPHYTGEEADEFVAVATPYLLEEYPENDPDPSAPFPFFRKSTLTVVFRSTQEVEILWGVIQREVCLLVEALCDLEDKLELVECVWCPGLAAAEESDIGSSISLSSAISESSSDSSE